MKNMSGSERYDINGLATAVALGCLFPGPGSDMAVETEFLTEFVAFLYSDPQYTLRLVTILPLFTPFCPVGAFEA
jgi:hypothetical protein